MDNFEAALAKLIIREEGEIKFYTFDSTQYSDSGSALKKSMPVFYNPIQEVNRSLSQIVYRAFQQVTADDEHFQPFTICDSMAASGIRSLRLLKYLDPPIKIISNDLNPLALKIIEKNLELNNFSIEDLELTNEDATFLFSKLHNSRQYPSCIDIDPFGTPNIFIESALRAVTLRGLVGITATDTAVLFGVKPTACARKYNLQCLRSSFLKEVGLRLLLYYTAIRAHPYMNYIEPQMSLSFEHYIRIFVRVFKGKSGVNRNLANSGYMLWCPKCDWRKTIGLDLRGSQIGSVCPLCNSKIKYGGPLWIGPLHDNLFVEKSLLVLNGSTKEQIPSMKRLSKLLNIVKEENQFPPGYYDLHKLCDLLNVSVSKTADILQKINHAGFQAGMTHIEPRAIKSDIPIDLLKEILVSLHKT
ncbi:tRNA (guanine(10)-N(2))-dimethyltransferase [Candidatus Lokiarchaeum ossiferum]|uniref:tRNA (guanine(10)-N(2))-dimethyltransferase n=1 Tax=Candidatus Lokiarchaeum ossiferum TaxID=2951803 RepID=UPI00352D5343